MSDFSEFKAAQKRAWPLFIPFEVFTGTCAPRLVEFAGIRAGQSVLDVGCGTGVAALAAARAGARATGVDLTPELVARAKENARIARLQAEFSEGDAEALPFGDASFDVVISQFAHILAPRPDVATRELLRVLKPGGTLAFASFPPELFTGLLMDMLGDYMPPPPGMPSATLWGKPDVVRERLGAHVTDLVFDRARLDIPALSIGHMREQMERSVGPVAAAVARLSPTPDKLAAFRERFETLISHYFDPHHNMVREDYLLSRAKKA